jgi:hypothetical protein
MEFNILAFGYLFLRLAPFILVCFFTLSSIFNQDYKGFIYLIGLLFACFLNTTFGKMFEGSFQPPPGRLEICNMMPITQNSEISVLPLGQTVFGYTFAYMLFSIIKFKIVTQNWPTLLFFPILIISDVVWNIQYNCSHWYSMVAALGIGMLFGSLWGYMISLSNTIQLQYYAGVNSKETCSVPAKNTFKCGVYRNGTMITSKQL